ncbi:hypothetical protein JCM8547_008562 [Rhodosporidiobolus lusitaniae]
MHAGRSLPPASPAPLSRASLPSDLQDYLDDLPLAACVFEHAALSSYPLAPPVYANFACAALLDQGIRTGVTAKSKDDADETLVDCMSDAVRDTLRRWLVEGAEQHSSFPSSSSSWPPSPLSPSSPSLIRPIRSRPPPRTIPLKLDNRISWPPVAFGASVRQDYTVLTALPPSELARGNASPAQSPLSSRGNSFSMGAVSEALLESAGEEEKPTTERMGDVEVDVERAKDATTLDGMAATLWQAPLAVFRVNRQFSIVQTNPKWRETTDIPASDSTDAWASRIVPEDRQRTMDHYQAIVDDLEAGRPVPEHDEWDFRWIPRPNGEEQFCQAVIQPFRLAGRIEGYTCYMINVNKHKAFETAAQQRECELRDELALLSETCQVGLSRHSVDGTFLSVNKAWREITRLSDSEPLSDWEKNMHPDDRERALGAWQNALEKREPLSVQFRWMFGENCLVQVQPQTDGDKVTGWIGSVTNITAQVKAQQAVQNLLKEQEARAKHEMEEAQTKAKAALEEKRQQELLIDVTSHEIRNPISAILQNADFTRSSLQSLRSTLVSLKERSSLPSELDGKLFDDLEEDIEALDSITECGLAQERIANDILGLAQIQLSKYSITPVEFDLATSLRNICRMFKSECRSKGIELKLVIGSSLARLGPRARVFADPARLTQVLVNLLSNAIRFTAKSAVREVTLAVEVSSKPPGRASPLCPPNETEYRIREKRPIYLFFSVEDTGPGMTEEETGKLFAKFSQGSPFTHTAWGGSGLGLWIARNLCELQAGAIEVASTLGKGSVFRCFITARSVDAGPDEEVKDSVPVVEGITGPNADLGRAPKAFLTNPGEQNKPLSGLKVLCCEDNQINRTVLKRQLMKEGCDEVLLACDGQEGLDLLNSRADGEINCLLMDIEMPVMDGLTATRAIRQAEQDGKRSGHQRIIGLTGNARSAQKDLALKSGMDQIVTKPYKIGDLIDKITTTELDHSGEQPSGPHPASSSDKTSCTARIPKPHKRETVLNITSEDGGEGDDAAARTRDDKDGNGEDSAKGRAAISEAWEKRGDGVRMPASKDDPDQEVHEHVRPTQQKEEYDGM